MLSPILLLQLEDVRLGSLGLRMEIIWSYRLVTRFYIIQLEGSFTYLGSLITLHHYC